MNYDEIKNYFYNRSFGDSKERVILEVFNRVEKIIDKKDIEAYYPKNLFLGDKPFELFLFCKERRIIYLVIENSNFIKTKYININNIDNVTMKENVVNTSEKILEIILKNGECLEFNSKEDTNEHHVSNFSQLIEQILKYIVSV